MVAKRKLLSGILTLSLLCSGIYVNAEEEAQSAGEVVVSQAADSAQEIKVSEKVSGLLQALGLMDENETASSGYVTRGFAADILARVDNRYYGSRDLGKMYFDVPADYIYAYQIETMSECGYLFGTGDGNFNPDGNITPAQMATILLRLAGYPNNSIANSQEFSKLLKNAGNYEQLTYAGLANMLYNFLDINIVALSGSYSSSNLSYKKSDTDTILNNCLDIEKVKGVVTENDITGLWAGTDLKKNRVAISDKGNNIVIDVGETDIASMLGVYVEAYCKDDGGDVWVCVYYSGQESRNEIAEIDLFSIDYDESTDSQIQYYVDGRRHRAKYGRNTAIIYNGTYYADTEAILSKVNGKDGIIVWIDNDGDGVADALNIEAYDTYMVSSVVLSTNTVLFKNSNTSLSLDKEDYDQFVLIDEAGNDFYIADFVDGMILSVAQNSAGADKKAIKALVSEETVNGTVTAVSIDDFGKNVVQLDNIDEYILLNNVALPTLGQGVIVVLNAFGRVAWIDYTNVGEFAYGIITEVKLNRRISGVVIKMITAQNTIETFEITEKLRIDKATYRDINTIYAKLSRTDNVSVGNQKLPAGVYPVRYKLRSDGSLAELDTDKKDTSAGENDNTLELLDSGYRMLQNELVMGGIFALRSSTPVFSISGSTTEGVIDKEYFEDTKYTDMANVSDLMSAAHKYNYAAYKVDNDSVYADFVIISSSWGQGYDDKLFVVEKITTAYDESRGEVVRCVQGIENGVEKQLLVSGFYTEEFDEIGLVCGDVIRYKADGYGQLIFVEDVGGNQWVVKHKLSDPSAKAIDINNISSGRTSISDYRNEAYSTQMVFGYVKERRGSFVTLSVIQPNTHNLDGKRSSTDMGKETILIKIPDTASITVYDPSKQDKVFSATYDEILDYKHNGNNCSLMAIHFRTGRFMDAVVLNDYPLYK